MPEFVDLVYKCLQVSICQHKFSWNSEMPHACNDDYCKLLLKWMFIYAWTFGLQWYVLAWKKKDLAQENTLLVTISQLSV